MAVSRSASPEPGATPGTPRKGGLRRVVFVVLGALAGVLLLAASALLVIQFADLGGPAGRIATRLLGRPVAVGSLHVGLGAPLTIDVADLRVANVPGGSRPDMVTLRRLTADIAPWPLLAGRVEIRRLVLDAPSLMLERNDKDIGNWRFAAGSGSAGPAAPPGAGRAALPLVSDLALHRGEVVFRTTSGQLLHIVLAEVAIRADGDQPVKITAEGAYNAFPIRLTATGQPFAALRDPSVPYGLDAVATSLGGTVTFKGTMVDPLNVDGVKGALRLEAPPGARIIAAAGLPGAAAFGVSAGATLNQAGNAWRLTQFKGTLGRDAFEGTGDLLEGARRQPDHVDLDVAFRMLDLDRLATAASGGTTGATGALPVIEEKPGTTIDAHIAAADATYGKLRVSDLDLHGSVAPGRVAVSDATLGIAGAKASLSASAEPARPGTRITASVSVSGADAARLTQMLDAADAGLSGRLDGRAALDMTGTTTTDALRSSHASAVIAMRDGEVARALIEKASIDLRTLLRKGAGAAQVTCLLGIADLRNGAGPVSPLRLRTSEGTLVGGGQIDLLKRSLDVTLRTERATTGFFALDVPVRISGAFADPNIRPALQPENRSPVTPVDIGRLPPDLQQLARGNPCLR